VPDNKKINSPDGNVMITIYLNENAVKPLYMQLYESLKEQIAQGILKSGEKLPSKRKLANHLKISLSTVEMAYQQLILEGYIYALEKRGFFIEEKITTQPQKMINKTILKENFPQAKTYEFNLQTNLVDAELFPNQVWAKLAKEVFLDHADEMLNQTDPQGLYALREQIALYLNSYRGIQVSPKHIVIGSGSESLIRLVIQLLGRNKLYALENPGYPKMFDLFEGNQVKFKAIELDESGLSIEQLYQSQADVVHLTPSHQFPLGIVMPVRRRNEMLLWAQKSQGYIIEDDYDSEFRFLGKPIPAMLSLDQNERVIYMNTFTKSLAPSFRISYLVIPPHLLLAYQKISTYHGCGVPNVEQYILERFMREGYFERHINKMRKSYRNKLDFIMKKIDQETDRSKVIIKGYDAGLHIIMEIHNGESEQNLIKQALDHGVLVFGMSRYYYKQMSQNQSSTMMIGFSNLSIEKLDQALNRLFECWKLLK
jgi:GntR family transcriptional regulator / MocR family aminotransferase